jgi:hypothetical protein
MTASASASAGLDQPGDQLDLGVGGQDHGLVLEPVARADLDDLDLPHQGVSSPVVRPCDDTVWDG